MSKNKPKKANSGDSKEVAAAKRKKLSGIPSPGTWERKNIPDIPVK
jgi:hypothetical protein